jgi:hypothetical protein
MIRAGDSIENPVTGERLVFRKTSRETGGQAVVIETFVQPNGFVAAARVPDSGSPFPPARRTSSGMRATKRRTSCARSGPRCSSSR